MTTNIHHHVIIKKNLLDKTNAKVTVIVLSKAIHAHMCTQYTHTHRFNGYFTHKPRLARCPLDIRDFDAMFYGPDAIPNANQQKQPADIYTGLHLSCILTPK